MDSVDLSSLQIGLVAPSSVVPPVEFKMGAEALKESGFRLRIHPNSKKKSLFFAGTHEERAKAFTDMAYDSSIPVIWVARGGYGANHLLPRIEDFTKTNGNPPKKLLVGYSDSTSLMEFARTRWGWSTLHGPMPSYRKFSVLPSSQWKTITSWVARRRTEASWEKKKLKLLSRTKVTSAIEAPVVGGNLSVWTGMAGTPYFPKASGSILFFEDIGEPMGRIDRIVEQLRQSGGFDGVLAIVLGDFLDCADYSPKGLTKQPKNKRVLLAKKKLQLKNIRAVVSPARSLKSIFGELGDGLGIPVLSGLPMGHGPSFFPLPLGAKHRLTTAQQLEVVHWDWFS